MSHKCVFFFKFIFFIAFRGFRVRQKYGPLLNENTGQIDTITAKFVQAYAMKWRKKSIFQVLLLYRAAKYQDFVNFTQQVRFNIKLN